jgi:PAS domain S-box-containing protein
MKPSNRLTILFFGIAVVLISGIGAIFWTGQIAIQSAVDVRRHDSVVQRLQDTLSTLKDAETGQRGFLLTGNRTYLEPYNVAVSGIPLYINAIKSYADSGEIPAEEMRGIVAGINEKMAELARTVELTREGRTEEALAVVNTSDGNRTMQDIRDRIDRLIQIQNRASTSAVFSARRAMTARNVVFAVVILICLAFLVWVYRRIRREMNKQHVSALDNQRQKEILSVTLASIGDAVILTDTSARITYLNAAAEELTGWKSQEAQGEACEKVFRIVDETTRETAASPVSKVLASGRTVGLATRTLLIRKDGSELPIDDSGAPIRERDGTIRGVVLVFRDFSEHKAAEKLLVAAKQEVEAASRAKDRFIAALSHELRTPITPLLATLSNWKNAKELPENWPEVVSMLLRNVEIEARLIDDLLDLARIQSGRMSLQPTILPIGTAIEAARTVFQSEIASKKLQVRVDGPMQTPVSADPARIQQVFWNLLGNAIKFTPVGGSIQIRTELLGSDTIRVVFTDTGVGMTRGTIESLFQRFEQGEGAASRDRNRGLGLGLAISKALVEAHHGTISGESDGPGNGSRFVVTLPVAMPKDGPAIAGSARPAPEDPMHLKLLLLEDHADTATVLTLLLQSHGHHVVTCGTIAQALDVIRSRPFDVILSDIGLPDGSGIDFLREARKMCTTPAIALTGYGMEADLAAYAAAGFDRQLTKPVDFELLVATIQAVIPKTT